MGNSNMRASVAETAIGQVEDALKNAFERYPALSSFTVLTDQSPDIAIEEGAASTIIVSTTAYQVDQSDEQNQSFHTATMEIEVVSRTQYFGTINRENQTTIAHVLSALAADRTLGGILQDLQEIDVAPAGANGRDVGAASLQIRVEFFTSRNDWFVIIPQP